MDRFTKRTLLYIAALITYLSYTTKLSLLVDKKIIYIEKEKKQCHTK